VQRSEAPPHSSEDESQFTSISCREETRNRVRALKRGGESYDDVLHRLLQQAELPENDPTNRT